MPVTIYHNPRCSTSRKVLALLRDQGIEPEIVEYLKTPPSAAELKTILRQLKMPAAKLLRRKEAAVAVKWIRSSIARYGLTPEDVFL